jgi:hypothetical protein
LGLQRVPHKDLSQGEGASAVARVRALLLGVLVLVVGCCSSSTKGAPSSTVAETSATSVTTSTTGKPSVTATIATTGGHTPQYVTVRYRSDPVDLAHPAFEYLDTAGSSLVGGAWYDSSTGYMVIRLSGAFYHYCGVPSAVWSAFGGADSFGSFYNASIKGRYGCEGVDVPDY